MCVDVVIGAVDIDLLAAAVETAGKLDVGVDEAVAGDVRLVGLEDARPQSPVYQKLCVQG